MRWVLSGMAALVLLAGCQGRPVKDDPPPQMITADVARYSQLSTLELAAGIRDLQEAIDLYQSTYKADCNARDRAAEEHRKAKGERKGKMLVWKLETEAAAEKSAELLKEAEQELFAAKQAYKIRLKQR